MAEADTVKIQADVVKSGEALMQTLERKCPEMSYLRDSNSNILAPFRPVLRSSADDVRSSWRKAAAMAIDTLHNSGWLSGAVEQASVDTIGNGLTLNSLPDAQELGWSDDFRSEWCERVEKRWQRWSNSPYECDIRGKLTVGQMSDAMIKWHYAYGEGIAIFLNKKRAHAESRLKVMMQPPYLLPLETNELVDPKLKLKLKQGVFVNSDDMAVGYRFKSRGKHGQETTVDINAHTRYGQRQVLHVFSGDPAQIRGITPLAPVLKVIKQYEQLADATLTTSLMQTILAATITSSDFTEDVLAAFNSEADAQGKQDSEAASFMAAKLEWASRTKIDLGEHGKVVQLFPGEKLDLNNAASPGDNYLDFSKNLLREVARCIGVTYETLTLDNSTATYSSVRMGVSTIRPVTLRRRATIVVPFVQAVHERWLDEEIITGRVEFPGGYSEYKRKKSAVTATQWHGPAPATADDFKSAKAQTERIENGTSSVGQECAEAGTDFETVFKKRLREHKMFKKEGMASPYDPVVKAGATTGIPEEDIEGQVNGRT